MSFYREVERVLNGERSNGWIETAKRMGMDLNRFTKAITKENLSFEECLAVVVASESPDLLAYTLNQLDRTQRFSHHIATAQPDIRTLN